MLQGNSRLQSMVRSWDTSAIQQVKLGLYPVSISRKVRGQSTRWDIASSESVSQCVVWYPLALGRSRLMFSYPFCSVWCPSSSSVCSMVSGEALADLSSCWACSILSYLLGRCHMPRNASDSFAPLTDCHPLNLLIRMESNVSPQRFHHVFFQLRMTKSHLCQHRCSLPVFGVIAFHHFPAKYITTPVLICYCFWK